MPVSGQHEPVLVLLSLLIAAASSFGALDHAGGCARRPAGPPSAGSPRPLLMGGGTWAMHLVGMLALHLPTKGVRPRPLPAVPGPARRLHRRLLLGLLAHRLEAGGLPRLGHAHGRWHLSHAPRRPRRPDHRRPRRVRPYLVGASALISVLASLFALYLASVDLGLGWRLAAASVLAAAVSGMHYVGMEGLSVICRPANPRRWPRRPPWPSASPPHLLRPGARRPRIVPRPPRLHGRRAGGGRR